MRRKSRFGRYGPALAVAILVCAAAVAYAVVWPRLMPRYIAGSGGVLDRWTDSQCVISGGVCRWPGNSKRSPLRRVGDAWR